MAQHDFVPAWLNFSTPQSAKSPTATFEKHGEHLPRGDRRFGVSRRRHNSSDGFFLTMDRYGLQEIPGISPPFSAMILWTLVSQREHMLESQGIRLVGMALPEVMMA